HVPDNVALVSGRPASEQLSESPAPASFVERHLPHARVAPVHVLPFSSSRSPDPAAGYHNQGRASSGSSTMTAMPPAGTIAIDVGGTFTDITLADAATGATWVAKTPPPGGHWSGALPPAIRTVLAQAGRASPDILRVFHGTTTATNAILEGRTPPIALVTTAGFKYVLEIGRHDIPRHGN